MGSLKAPPERVLVCGSRYWTDRKVIEEELRKLPEGSIVIHGSAKGADTIAGRAAWWLGFKVEQFPARWDLHGTAAGPIRNQQMIDTKPTLVLAFHSNLNDSKGTKDCVARARRHDIPVRIITGEEAK